MSSKQPKSNYDRLSRYYDLLTGSHEKKVTDMGLQILGVQPGEQVLEIGFGTGNSIITIAAQVGDHGKICGIDISMGMLRVALKKVIRSKFSSVIDLVTGNATRLPYGNNTFDAVFMSFTLEIFNANDIHAVLKECSRVLKSNGRMCVIAMSDKGKSPLLSLYRCAHRLFPRYIDCRPIPLVEYLHDYGFSIIESNLVTMWGLPIEIVLVRNKNSYIN